MRLQEREEKGENYDPFCLSDLESDDEWITEREDPALPADVSWMDIHEAFEGGEGSTKKEKKRGNIYQFKYFYESIYVSLG